MIDQFNVNFLVLFSAIIQQDQIKSKTTECVDLADSLTSTKENLDAVKLTLGELQSQFDQVEFKCFVCMPNNFFLI